MKLSLPLSKEVMSQFKAGDIVELTGYIYTARDAAHSRIAAAIEKGEKPPIDLENAIIYYAGPCPAKPGFSVGSIGPTTSARMDTFVELMFEQGVSAMIGKGDRADYTVPLYKKYGGIYFLGIGGAAAIATKCVKSVEVAAFEDLGTESIKRLYVEDFKVIVGIDAHENVLTKTEVQKYRR